MEDNPDVRAYLHRHLADDYHVIEAKDGAEGRALAREWHPDLVLTDLMMSEVDGFELCEKIWADDDAFLDRVTEVIEDNLSHPNFTVDDLAAGVGLSPQQLQRKLKRITEVSPASFVRQYRLDVAAQRLEEDTGAVSGVACAVGFGTRETFTRRFKEQ